MSKTDEHTLEYLLAFDGRVYYIEQSYWLKFEIKRIKSTTQRPHGLKYSFTLHDPNGKRLIGFDNAHGVPSVGARFKMKAVEYDHWHRNDKDRGRPYEFIDADTLLADFEAEVRRVLGELGIDNAVKPGNDK